jgi:chromosome segregation ATPase
VRPLIDYQEAFNSTYVRRHEVTERIAHFQREGAELTKANLAGQEGISFRQIENQQLTSDLGNYKREVEVLTKEVALVEEKLATTRTKIAEMYRQIQTRASVVSQ